MGQRKIPIDREALERLYIHEKQSPKAIAIHFGCNRQTVINRLREYGLAVRTKAEGTAIAKTTHHWAAFSDNLIERAYLIGLRIGDLTVDMANPNGQTIRISCASTRPEQIELIENWIMQNNDTFWAFLGGYADAEAHIGISGHKASFRLSTADKNILLKIWGRLSETGIQGPGPYIWLPKGRANKQGTIMTTKDIWRLGVYRTDSLKNLLQSLLPFLQHAKRSQDARATLEFLLHHR